MKVVNDVLVALDKKQHSALLFIDLSKAFDTVDQEVLKLRLINSGLSEQAVAWFSNYLSDTVGLSVLDVMVCVPIL